MTNEVDPLANLENLDEQYNNVTPATSGGDSFECIPEDTEIAVVVTDQKPAFVGVKRTPVCKATFEVVAPQEYLGKKVWHDFWLTAANLAYLKRDMDTLGWKGRPTMLLQNEDASLITLGAVVVVGIEEFQSKDRNTGQPLFNADGTPKMRQKNTIKFFKAPYTPTTSDMAAKAAAAKAAPAPKAEPAKPVVPPQPTQDTIPF